MSGYPSLFISSSRLAQFAANDARREAHPFRVGRARKEASLRRQDRRQSKAQDRDCDEDLEQREAACRRGACHCAALLHAEALVVPLLFHLHGTVLNLGAAGERTHEHRQDIVTAVPLELNDGTFRPSAGPEVQVRVPLIPRLQIVFRLHLAEMDTAAEIASFAVVVARAADGDRREFRARARPLRMPSA